MVKLFLKTTCITFKMYRREHVICNLMSEKMSRFPKEYILASPLSRALYEKAPVREKCWLPMCSHRAFVFNL